MFAVFHPFRSLFAQSSCLQNPCFFFVPCSRSCLTLTLLLLFFWVQLRLTRRAELRSPLNPSSAPFLLVNSVPFLSSSHTSRPFRFFFFFFFCALHFFVHNTQSAWQRRAGKTEKERERERERECGASRKGEENNLLHDDESRREEKRDRER